jgi:hypothetical protein
VAIIKHDSLDKAPLNDAALSRQQKFYTGSRFKSYKVYLLSCPQAQKLPGDISVDARCYAIKHYSSSLKYNDLPFENPTTAKTNI